MSSPGLTFGHMAGLLSRSSLVMAISCSHDHRSMSPLTNPSACSTDMLPLLRKSPILMSQHQPVQAMPYLTASCLNGAMPRLSWSAMSAVSLAWLMKTKLLSCRPHLVVMLLTVRSNLPVWFRSAKSAPMPLNEPLPSTKDLAVVGVRCPLASSSRMLPGVDLLYSRWS